MENGRTVSRCAVELLVWKHDTYWTGQTMCGQKYILWHRSTDAYCYNELIRREFFSNYSEKGDGGHNF